MKLRQQSIKPRVGPIWAWCPVWLHRLHATKPPWSQLLLPPSCPYPCSSPFSCHLYTIHSPDHAISRVAVSPYKAHILESTAPLPPFLTIRSFPYQTSRLPHSLGSITLFSLSHPCCCGHIAYSHYPPSFISLFFPFLPPVLSSSLFFPLFASECSLLFSLASPFFFLSSSFSTDKPQIPRPWANYFPVSFPFQYLFSFLPSLIFLVTWAQPNFSYLCFHGSLFPLWSHFTVALFSFSFSLWIGILST